MTNEKMQPLILALVVVGFIVFGAIMMKQGAQLDRVSNAVMMLSSNNQGMYQPQMMPPQGMMQPQQGTMAPQGTMQVMGNTQDRMMAPVPPSTSTRGMEVLNPMINKVGDVIAGLRLASLGPVQGIERPMAQDNVSATFSGRVTLSGEYEMVSDAMSGTDRVCFTPSQVAGAAKLPVLIGQEAGASRFCFTNAEKARTSFGSTSDRGRATITIDQYQLNYAPAEVMNMAQLVAVVSKN